MNILILEDDPNRHVKFRSGLIGHVIRITADAKECITLLKKNDWDILFLDHDLGGKQMVKSGVGTGWEVSRWLSQHKDRIPKTVYIHSMNPEGSKNMKADLPNAIMAPFITIRWQNQ